jgi:hypothetical protein
MRPPIDATVKGKVLLADLFFGRLDGYTSRAR